MMKRAALGLVAVVACSNEPPPVTAGVVEIPAQPAQPLLTASAPPPPQAQAEPEPWANGLPPASGVIAQPTPTSTAPSKCSPPFTIDPSTGHRRYKVECMNVAPPPPPKIRPIPIP